MLDWELAKRAAEEDLKRRGRTPEADAEFNRFVRIVCIGYVIVIVVWAIIGYLVTGGAS